VFLRLASYHSVHPRRHIVEGIFEVSSPLTLQIRSSRGYLVVVPSTRFLCVGDVAILSQTRTRQEKEGTEVPSHSEPPSVSSSAPEGEADEDEER